MKRLLFQAVFLAMGIIFLIGLSVCFWAESQGNPALAKIGLSQSMGSMEGKEVRFGIAQSAMFTTTTATTEPANRRKFSICNYR